jgi:hypothetical protein
LACDSADLVRNPDPLLQRGVLCNIGSFEQKPSAEQRAVTQTSVADADPARTAVPLLTPRSNGPSGNWVSAGFACSASALFCISHTAPPAPPMAMAEKSIDRHAVVEFSWVGPANDWLAEIPRQLLRRSCDARTVSIFLRGRSRNDRDPLPPRCRPHCRPHRNFAAD